jgi:hypothetical protein
MVTLACVSSPTVPRTPWVFLKDASTRSLAPPRLPSGSLGSSRPSKPPLSSGVIGSYGCHTLSSKGSSRLSAGKGKGVEDVSEKHALLTRRAALAALPVTDLPKVR